MEKNYWEKVYDNNNIPKTPSNFAEFCLEYFQPKSTILDIGCGNGRDSIFFSENDFRVFAFDQSETSIKLLKQEYPTNPSFSVADIKNFNFSGLNINVAYSRFLLHAISESTFNDLFENIYNLLPSGGIFVSESRSDRTHISEVGQTFDPHFRRLINLNELLNYSLSKKFKVLYHIEDTGLSVYEDEDPFIIRLILQK